MFRGLVPSLSVCKEANDCAGILAGVTVVCESGTHCCRQAVGHLMRRCQHLPRHAQKPSQFSMYASTSLRASTVLSAIAVARTPFLMCRFVGFNETGKAQSEIRPLQSANPFQGPICDRQRVVPIRAWGTALLLSEDVIILAHCTHPGGSYGLHDQTPSSEGYCSKTAPWAMHMNLAQLRKVALGALALHSTARRHL
jgi:hypothetical protein